MQGHDLLTTLGVHFDRLDVVRVWLWGAVLGDIEIIDADELPDDRVQVNGVVVNLHRVPASRQHGDGKAEGAAILDLISGLDIEGSQRRTSRRSLVTLILIAAGLVLLSAPGQSKRAHGERCNCGRQRLAHDKPPES